MALDSARKVNKAKASDPTAGGKEMRQIVKEGRLLREEERNRRQGRDRARKESEMDIDPLDDTEAEAAFLRNEARLAAEAQARATGSSQEKAAVGQQTIEDIEETMGVTKVAFKEGVKEGAAPATPSPGKAFAATPDVADTHINQHLRDLNMKGGEDQEGVQDMKSPVRKKSRAGRPDTPGPPKSIIKMHDHNHKRVILEAAVLLTDKNPYLQFAEMIRSLLGNALMVDVYFQIDPISKVSPHPPLRKKTEVPNNLTLLTEYIKISGNMMAFQKKKVFSSGGGSGRKKKTEEERDPVVWFCFAASFDLEAAYIIQRISFEWGNVGGSRLQVKAVYSFESATPIICFKLWIDTDQETLIAEFKKILRWTWEAEKDTLAPLYGDTLLLPEFGVRITAPWVPGIRADWKTQNARRVIHFEMDCGVIPLVKHLIARAKSLGIVAAVWGLKALVTESNVPLTERNKESLLSVLRSHATFHSKMLDQELQGIDNLDAKEPFYKVTDPTVIMGYMSLRDLLLKYTKLKSGKPAIAEVHQGCQLGRVTVVFPNVEEAETMVERMNKNIAAYLRFKLYEDGLPEDLLERIMKASCDAETYAKGLTCTWDDENQTILFPEEKEGDEDEVKAQEQNSWYAQEMGVHMVDKVKRTKRRPHTREEDMYDLDTVGTVKTIHEVNKKRAERAARVAKDLSDEEDSEEEVEEEKKSYRAKKPPKEKRPNKKDKGKAKKDNEGSDDSDQEGSSVEESNDDSLRRKSGPSTKKKTFTDSASKAIHGKPRASSGSRVIEVLSSDSDSSSSSSSDSSDESDSQDDGAGSG